MKTARQLIKEYIDKGSNMPIEGMALLTKFECELLMEQYAQEVVKNNFVLAPVSGSLQDRLFELANDFAKDKKGDVAVKLHSIHNGLQ